ncbi:MAG TPA: FAD-dependent oxidoreductase [Nevskiaceae bacterium]|nr:FAD-dependent oxidoreductase [Nevskiaceae bacterium]
MNQMLKGAVALLIAGALLAFFLLDGARYLSLDFFQAQRAALEDWRAARPVLAAALFFGLYVAVTALSIPGAAVLTLAAGALFGFWQALLLVSFASSLGATLAFLSARLLLREAVLRRYGERLRTVNEGLARDGARYLFSLRLIPALPFFAINLLMGLTPIRTGTFYWVSQLGMLPGTAVYVNAGTQLGALTSLSGILSPSLLGAFVLLGLFPWLLRGGQEWLRRRRLYAPYTRPARFDRNLIVIGAGSAGLVSAYIAAAVRAQVTLIERHRMGGDCLNTGCVPSKALIRSARAVAELRRAGEYGLRGVQGEVDFAAVMARVRGVVRDIEPHDSVERYRALGVDCRQGEARLIDPWTVEIDGRERLTARAIIIASGAEPTVPPIPGLAEAGYLTSDTLWDLDTLPPRLLVLGGGPIGCELAQAFARLGSTVTVIEQATQLMPREDAEVAERVAASFRAEGLQLCLGQRAVAVRRGASGIELEVEGPGGRQTLLGDQILVAVGRTARLRGFGLEALGVETGRTLTVNRFQQTSFPNIYACGDVTGPYQFTHTAAHTAWYAAVNSLFGPLLWLRGGRFPVDYRVIPWVTFTSPEVARVGLNETEARAQGIPHEVSRYDLADLDRAIAEGEAHGEIKVLTAPGRDRILGATLVGPHAGELLAEVVLAMKHGLGLNQLLATIHVYPTWNEANKYLAGQWKQAHKPEGLLRWVERFHRWRLRG